MRRARHPRRHTPTEAAGRIGGCKPFGDPIAACRAELDKPPRSPEEIARLIELVDSYRRPPIQPRLL